MNELQRIKPIFEQALDRKGDDRRAYLAEACGGDPDLRNQVEALLQAHEGAPGFLESPALEPHVRPADSAVSEGPGTVIGRYKLLEKIGEGGMAVVYMAEQKAPIRRKVALKIIKLGMDTKQVIARFEAERQALALMDHPNIAKVFDAGATLTGRPYFVMELVQGAPITEYCDANSLSTKDRLALFIQVCHAVQHAHQKGIIHRDIKPSNVMVTHHDGKPVPKVIDFGIAKATNQKLTEKTLFTRYAHIIGTPAYMSPEQAELSDLDIDTRTDIYSLGVLLYELLTGTTPFSEEELRQAGYVEMQRVIREQEPVKPSTRIRTAHRSMGVPPMPSDHGRDGRATDVRGDLDWIVMKSLEKDRARRYDTAGGLAEDIRRHLASEPILARGPSATYRAERFLRRHRSQVVVAMAMVVVAFGAGIVFSLWNRDRAQLAEAEGFKHRGILSLAREQHAKAERDAALETIAPILDSKHVGPEARLLRATILVDNRRSDEAVAILNGLLNERREVAGAAHLLLAQILWESDSPNAQTLAEIEEHRRQAEALPPKTAEAHFLRAMMAVTVKEQLAALGEAVQLASRDADLSNPIYYESRRLRAFTYYASRKYEKMLDDALAMSILRPRDPLGYSLQAIAWRELGRYPKAIADYDVALGLTLPDDPQYADLSAQRCETLLRMGDYDRVIADAQACLKLWPDKPIFQYLTFSAMTVLGDYDRATKQFRQIVAVDHEARGRLRDWCTKYVFDTLEAGRMWHPADHAPLGAAFLPMVEAERTYESLSGKGYPVTKGGFGVCWSPDGKKLAFSLGVHGYSGVAIFDLATKETDLLIVPGKYPRWSPDGRYIAFVRDCQALRLEELTAEREDRRRWSGDEEVWLIKPDGTEPRRLARGGWPSWSRDSTAIYYQARADKMLCSISIEDKNALVKPVVACPQEYPSISPDQQYVAYLKGASLVVKDLASQRPVAEWPAPLAASTGIAWSPTGRELCLGGGAETQDEAGLWIYTLDRPHGAGILDGRIASACWSPQATQLVFCLGLPHMEIWLAGLDPNKPTVEAIGPGQTLEEYYRRMLRLYSSRIDTDPQDAYAYSGRARCYDLLHDRARAAIDMRRWSAILSRDSCPDLASGRSWRFERVIGMPFDCELVFSAERPVNAIPTISVAFGQKGKGSMKSFQIPMVGASLLGLCLLAGLDAPPAQAHFTFGEPVNLRSTIPVIDPLHESINCLSLDGLEIYVASDRPGGLGNFDLWVFRRESIDGDWGPPQNLGPAVNGPGFESDPYISADGLALYFDSSRSGGQGNWDVYMTTRATKNAPWGPAVNLGSTLNSPSWDGNPWISADGLELLFLSQRPGGYGGSDIYVTKRAATNDPWGEPENLGPIVNSPYDETGFALSPDERLLLFSDSGESNVPSRPGGYGGSDMWMTRRAGRSSPWQAPVNLGPQVNSAILDVLPRTSPDGSTLYFATARSGTDFSTWENWQAPILPVVDFNRDSMVDDEDMAILADHWGGNKPLCDIGPMAWGDGVVDEKDLIVLMKYVSSPAARASDVGRDVVLRWAGPPFAEAHDVYFGTSFEAVNSADRNNPLGVLVSLGQTETTYDPEGLLEFGRSYYWRIDTVGVPADSTICKGSVLRFTTETIASPIRTVTATASSGQRGMGPERTVDGSGLDPHDGHSTKGEDMWLSSGAGPHWIQFQFDRVYKLHELWVWNSNQLIETIVGFGARNVRIEYSLDGVTWTTLDGVPEFAQARGKSGYAANTTVSFGGMPAKYVKLTIEGGWGVTPSVGLSEVRFFYTPTQARQPEPTNGQAAVSVNPMLRWQGSREAVSHQVHFGTDAETVANGSAFVAAVPETGFDPGPLGLGRTYYWKVDEVNDAGVPRVWEGDLWNFSTRECIVVDDFEGYTNESPDRVFQTWTDGAGFSADEFFPEGGSGNGTGSAVGHDPMKGNIMEVVTIHGGQQAMPVAYNNVDSPFYSEIERTFTPSQDWTTNGADTLMLYVYGAYPLAFRERADGSIVMSGGGADIFNAADQFRFACRQLNGDGTMVARVDSIVDTDIWAKCGVMIRQSLDPGSRFAAVYATPGKGVHFQARVVNAGLATSDTSVATAEQNALKTPVWVKLQRSGSNFSGFYSTDGKKWIAMSWNPRTVNMTGTAYIGLAVTSHNLGAQTVAQFSEVSTTGAITGPWQVQAIGAEQPSNDPAPLYVAIEDNAGHVTSVTHPDPAAVQTIEWQEWLIPLSDFASAGVDLTSVKKMSIGVGDPGNPTRGGTGVIYIDDIGVGHPLSSE